MDQIKPESPTHQRRHDRPYYIQTTCDQCGTPLVYSYLQPLYEEQKGQAKESLRASGGID